MRKIEKMNECPSLSNKTHLLALILASTFPPTDAKSWTNLMMFMAASSGIVSRLTRGFLTTSWAWLWSEDISRMKRLSGKKERSRKSNLRSFAHANRTWTFLMRLLSSFVSSKPWIFNSEAIFNRAVSQAFPSLCSERVLSSLLLPINISRWNVRYVIETNRNIEINLIWLEYKKWENENESVTNPNKRKIQQNEIKQTDQKKSELQKEERNLRPDIYKVLNWNERKLESGVISWLIKKRK